MDTVGRSRPRWFLLLAVVAVAALMLVSACSDDDGGGGATSTETADGGTATATEGGDGTTTATSTSTEEATSTAAASDDGPREGPEISVGAFDFPESQTLGWVYAQALEADGYPVDTDSLASGSPREIIAPALEGGDIDLVIEYVGSLLTYLGGEPTADGEANAEAVREQYGPRGVTVLEIAEAQNTNQVVARPEIAEQYGLETVSDLADVAGELTFGAPPECPERQFCAIGLREVYGVEFGETVPLAFGPRVTALQEGAVDVALLFSTDAVIQQEGFVPLEDDKDLQPAENLAPAINTEVLDAYGDDLVSLLNSVTAELTTEGLREMNVAVQFEQRDPEDVAREWLVDHGLIEE